MFKWSFGRALPALLAGSLFVAFPRSAFPQDDPSSAPGSSIL
jgi:hypothetical protein